MVQMFARIKNRKKKRAEEPNVGREENRGFRAQLLDRFKNRRKKKAVEPKVEQAWN